MTESFEVHRAARDGAYAICGNVLISVFWDRPSVEVLRQRIPVAERLCRQNPEGVGMLSILAADGDQKLPGRDVRRELEAQAVRFRDQFRGAVVAIEYRSIYLDLLRPFLRGVASFSKIPYRIASDGDEAVEWLLDQLGDAPGTPTPASLRAGIADLRGRI